MKNRTATAVAGTTTALELTPPDSCWFVGSNMTTTLRIGSLECEARNDVTANEAFAMASGLMAPTVEAWQEFTLRKAAAFLKSWNLPQILPDDTAEKITLLRGMRRGRFEQLYEAVLKHEMSFERRYHKGTSYGHAEWDAFVEAHKAEKPPKWNDLLAYIDPQVSIEADAWFVTEDASVTLQLPDDQWIRIKSELTQGEHVQLVASTKDAEDGVSSASWVGARKLAFYILDWSLTYPDGRKAPLGLDSLAELDALKFAILNQTVDAYERKLKEGREASPTGAQ